MTLGVAGGPSNGPLGTPFCKDIHSLTIDDETASRLIHHSDRGCQYCSDDYVFELKKHGISISMTRSGDPLEKATAELANSILKSEWLYEMTLPTREICMVELSSIIDFYNTQRPHDLN